MIVGNGEFCADFPCSPATVVALILPLSTSDVFGCSFHPSFRPVQQIPLLVQLQKPFRNNSGGPSREVLVVAVGDACI